MKRGQKALNYKEIRKKSLRFILSLSALSLYSFICIIFLYETKANKDDIILDKINAYNLISDKDVILTNKLESIYDKMTLIATNKVKNERFLRENIINEIRDCNNIIGEDSLSHFKHYKPLLESLDDMILLKSQLISINEEKSRVVRDLLECQDNIK